MKESNLETLTVAELVEKFAAIGVEEDEADKADNIAEYNRLHYQIDAVQKELKSREGDQRRALQLLYDHRNMQVRLMAAKYTLAVAPLAARRMIEAIAASSWFPQAGDAGMCLTMLDRGMFVPD